MTMTMTMTWDGGWNKTYQPRAAAAEYIIYRLFACCEIYCARVVVVARWGKTSMIS